MAVEGADSFSRARLGLIVGVSLVWLSFQFAIVASPQDPLLERSLHLVLAQLLVLLVFPARGGPGSRIADVLLIGGTLGVGLYYAISASRLAARIEMIDPIERVDMAAGVFLLIALLECVRRTVGWSLLLVLLAALLYAFAGPAFPGWSRFSGFDPENVVEMLTMTTHGVLGITTETSVQLVFFFILFGTVFGAIGGGRLFIDMGLAATARHKGGAAKAAVISSSLMGTVSGSAVANVVSVGVFTIPLMRRSGYSAEKAAGIEAMCSTGGQLMPPVMGVAAFVLAEMLQIDYSRVALAAVIPAVAFYFALFVLVDLEARKTGAGSVDDPDTAPILPRLYLLAPPALLVALLAAGYSATMAAIGATLACPAAAYLRRTSWIGGRGWLRTVSDIGKQACQVAVPIAAIGMIIAIAVQSNLAVRFTTRLIEGSTANLYGALALTALGCIVMGMGLPTVAAYIIGAIFFVPVLLKLGIAALPAHFFVMYYCVLSMITPPVALASFAAAGVAGADTMRTGWYAFRLSFVLFLIPFAFLFDPRLLWEGGLIAIALAFASLLAATSAWAVALVGYLRTPLGAVARTAFAAVSISVILFPTGSMVWLVSSSLLALLFLWGLFGSRRPGRSALRDEARAVEPGA